MAAAVVVSKMMALLVVLQMMLVAVAAAPASTTGSSSSELGASRRLLQVVSCIARGTIVSDCSKPCCDPVNDVCATVGDGLGGVFHSCVPSYSCGRYLVVCN